jgi:hypothetical protein
VFEDAIFPAPELDLESVNYFPALERAQILLRWEDKGPHVVTCRRFETVGPDGSHELQSSFSYAPRFEVPGDYCFRMYNGNESGRSAFSAPLCVNINVPPTEECSIDPSFGENTVCQLPPESVIVSSAPSQSP